jgi:predicted RNase H-like nuclease (RuvC/YqgF family)
MTVLSDVVPTVAGGVLGSGLLVYAVRVVFYADKSRQRADEDRQKQQTAVQERLDLSRSRVDTLETENAKLHDEINAIKMRVSVAESHAEGLRVEITWREAQALRLEVEIARLQTEIARLESELARLRRRGDDADQDERAPEEAP